MVQGFHPGDPSIWGKGAGLLFSQGGTGLFLDLLPFLAIPQKMVATTIVALNPLVTSPLGLLSTIARAALALLWLLFLDDLGPPERSPETNSL